MQQLGFEHAVHDNSQTFKQTQLRHPNAREAVPRNLGSDPSVEELRHTNPTSAQRKLRLNPKSNQQSRHRDQYHL